MGSNRFTLSARVASWVWRGRAFVFDIDRRRRYSWRVPGPSPDNPIYMPSEVGHTRHRVFVARTLEDDKYGDPTRIRLYSARIRP